MDGVSFTVPSPCQVRGARGMLDWSLVDLSRAAKLSVSTIRRFEAEGLTTVAAESGLKIRESLTRQGIVFLPDDGHGPGLRLCAPNGPSSQVG